VIAFGVQASPPCTVVGNSFPHRAGSGRVVTHSESIRLPCNVAAGVPRDEILQSYHALHQADIDAALAYAAELAREGTVDLPLETTA
jgi:hypothetical protein